ncbi:MAG: SCO family protein [Thermoguttaceae bacterium]
MAILLSAVFAQPAAAQQDEPPPQGFEGATITSKPNAQIPLNLEFQDEEGRTVRLGDFFQKDRPALLNMVFYRCIFLCGKTLENEAGSLGRLSLQAGKDFEIVTVSFDPRDGPADAALQKAKYIKMLGKPEAAPAWHFLTSRDPSAARRLGEAIGFGYKLDAAGEMYMHQAGIYACTPDGRVSQVLRGIQFDPDVLHDSLVFASEGKIGSRLFGAALSCGLIHYDPVQGKYTWAAVAIVNVAAILSVVVLGTVIGTLIYRDVRRKKVGC